MTNFTDIDSISKDDFASYNDVRKSGVTNMFDLKNVMAFTGLPKHVIVTIMSNYDYYTKKFNS
jgi:hypothetical protein